VRATGTIIKYTLACPPDEFAFGAEDHTMLILQKAHRSIAAILLLSTLVAAASGDERKAAELLPPTTVVFAEVHQPQQLLDAVYDHKLVQRIESLEQVRTAMEKKPYLDFKAGVAIVESQMGLPWRKIVGQSLGGGVTFAVDAKTKGVAILARGTDKTTHTKLLETLSNVASFDAKNKGLPEPVKTSDYRGIRVYTADKSNFAIVEDWLLISNNNELGKQIIDRVLDKREQSLSGEAQFSMAYKAASESSAAWAYVNTAVLRDAGVAKKLFGGQAENPLAELFVGGVLGTLQHTPYVTARLAAGDQHVRATVSAPFDRDWSKDVREYFFGPGGKGIAPSQLSLDGAILSLSSYRDISGMWIRAGDLFNEQVNEELAKADSNLTTLFGGKDFGEDILGALRPQVQFVVARQQFAKGQAAPAIKLPAFGLVAELKDPAKMQPELRRTFQSLVGFLNIAGAMNGQPQLDLDMEKTNGAQFVTASYLSDTNAKEDQGLKVHYNFSPSIAFVDDRFFVASTKTFVHALAAAPTGEPSVADSERVVNTNARLHFDALGDILADNRGQLVAQNMLKEGHTKAEAERDMAGLLEVIGWLDQLAFSLDTTSTELRLSLDLATKPIN
jgi:hypothetical protein